MATEKEAVRSIRSATEDTADAARNTAHTAAGMGQESVEHGAEAARKMSEQSSREFGRLVGFTTDASKDAARQLNQNLDVMLQVGSVIAQGYQSILSEWSSFAQNAAKRQTDALNDLMQSRNSRDLMSIQSDLLKDGIQHLLSHSAKVSELSAQYAHQAVEKLNARAKDAARDAERRIA